MASSVLARDWSPGAAPSLLAQLRRRGGEDQRSRVIELVRRQACELVEDVRDALAIVQIQEQLQRAFEVGSRGGVIAGLGGQAAQVERRTRQPPLITGFLITGGAFRVEPARLARNHPDRARHPQAD